MPKVIDHKSLYQASKNPRQWEAHQAPEKYILYGGAKGGGKTAWLVNEGIALSIDFPGNRGFLGCKELVDFRDNALKQLEKFLPTEITLNDGSKHPFYIHHKTERQFRLINGSVIRYGGLGNDAEAVQTINNMPELGWFGIDQAEQISERQFRLLTGQLRLVLPNIQYKGLLTANPEPGWLRDVFIENPKIDYRFIPALPQDNPFLPSDYIETLRKQFPPELVKRLVEGDWDVELEGNYLFPYRFIRDAANRNLEALGDKVMGVDIAYKGIDETVCIVRQGDVVIHIEAWGGEDTTYSAGRIAKLIREYQPKITHIESVGVGVGAIDPLKNEGFAIDALYPSAPASNDKIYANKRAENYNKLAKRFEDGEIAISDHAKLQAQLSTITYKYDTKTRLLITDKQTMRSKGITSPDYADALMLAFIEPPVFQSKPIESLHFPAYTRRFR